MLNIAGINKNCTQCKGNGFYYYDEHHGAICNLCCPHDGGFTVLKGEAWGKNQGKELCKRGCGTLRDNRKTRKVQEIREETLKNSNDTEADKYILDQGLFIVNCRYCSLPCVVASIEADEVCNNLDCHRAKTRIERVGSMREIGDEGL